MTKQTRTTEDSPLYRKARTHFAAALDPLMSLATQLPVLHADFDKYDHRRCELRGESPEWHLADNQCRRLLARISAVENAILNLPASTPAAAAAQMMIACSRVDGDLHIDDPERKNIVPGLESAFLAVLRASDVDPKSIGAQHYMGHLLDREWN